MKLFKFQKRGYKELYDILYENRVALEASGVGYGKTVVACKVAKKLGYPVAIVCPKTIIPDWERTAEACGVKTIFITNPEMLKSKKFKYGKWAVKNRKYQWTLPDKCLLIWDEVHRCKNWKTQNAKVLVATCRYNFRVLMMSATIATTPLDMYAVGMVLGLHDGSSDFFHWLHRHGVRRGTFGFEFRGGKEHLDKLNEALFPARGHRELPCDIPGFPKNQVSVMSIQTGRNSEIDKALENLNSIRKDDAPLPIVDQLRARQTVELMKIPAIAELAEDYRQAGNSIAVFLNFKESIHQLAVKLNTPCLITGDQTDDERAWNIDLFQSNSEPVIICQIQCGGVGVSLHDVNNKPRVALISPSYSAVDLVQALGRINRASSVSPAVQKILVAAGTIEENIRNKVEKKIDNLNAILDSDLDFFS